MVVLDGVESFSLLKSWKTGKKMKAVRKKQNPGKLSTPSLAFTFYTETSCKMMAWTIATILRDKCSNIVSVTVVARPKLSWILVIWNPYRKGVVEDTTQNKNKKNNRWNVKLRSTQGTVGYSVRVNRCLVSFNTTIYSSAEKRGLSQMRTYVVWEGFITLVEEHVTRKRRM